ncbi:stage VI sporulation protein D [Lentibacillus saliphilus]|uniref:stage VI sporulation protein D n=1 Tax=Lentibacillus saliphilus TaxID=2737028 RepID=UPI001C2F2EBF|nr:stage VI sporulation protein D [Lentibacillus saliphilus]
MNNEDAVFTFDLHESLYFQSGQEVAEMRGISLDPEIAIQDYGDYIAIRGVIELQGEYLKHLPMADSNMVDDFADDHSKRYVERVMDTEDHAATFMHRFPVEISVPSYRVTGLDDVSVSIDTFDYELPNPTHLKFSSKIAIHGIQDEPEEDGYDERDSEFSERTEPESIEQFSFETKRPLEEPESVESESSSSNDEDLQNESVSSESEDNVLHQESESSSDESSSRNESASHEDEQTDKERWQWKQSQTLGEFFAKDSSPESTSDESSNVSMEDAYESSEIEQSSDYDDVYLTTSSDDYESSSENVRDVMYLANMFKEEEEHYAKMRVCIVQSDDTLDGIASRYNVLPDQIRQSNQLESDHVSEGQLLFIPYQKQKNKQ